MIERKRRDVQELPAAEAQTLLSESESLALPAQEP